MGLFVFLLIVEMLLELRLIKKYSRFQLPDEIDFLTKVAFKYKLSIGSFQPNATVYKKPAKTRRSNNPKSRGPSTSRRAMKNHLSARSKTFDHGDYATKIIKQVQLIYPGCFDKKECETACIETV